MSQARPTHSELWCAEHQRRRSECGCSPEREPACPYYLDGHHDGGCGTCDGCGALLSDEGREQTPCERCERYGHAAEDCGVTLVIPNPPTGREQGSVLPLWDQIWRRLMAEGVNFDKPERGMAILRDVLGDATGAN